MDTSELEMIAEMLEGHDDLKTILLTVSPTIMAELGALGDILPPGPGGGGFELGPMAGMQYTLYGEYFHNPAHRARTEMRRIREEMEFFDGGNGKSYLDFINLLMEDLDIMWNDMVDAYAAFRREHAPTPEDIAAGYPSNNPAIFTERWTALRETTGYFINKYYDIRYYTESSATNTNYLFMWGQGSTFIARSEDYQRFRNALRDVEGANNGAWNNLYALNNEFWRNEELYNFYSEFSAALEEQGLDEDAFRLMLALQGMGSDEIDARMNRIFRFPAPVYSEPGDSVSANQFFNFMEVFLNNARGSRRNPNIAEFFPGVFYSYNEFFNDSAEHFLIHGTHIQNGGYTGGQQQFERDILAFIEFFDIELDENDNLVFDRMKPFRKIINSSLSAAITPELYDRYFRPFYDGSEGPAILALETRLNQLLGADYSQAKIVMAFLEMGDTNINFEEFYAELRDIFKNFVSRTSTLRSLIQNSYAHNVLSYNRLSDAQAREIQGMLLSSRYMLRSQVTRTQFLITEDRLASEFTVPENLDGGWGYMNFAFMLSSIIILIFGIVLSAGMIAGEHSAGTMKLLLIRPHTRRQVMLSKFLAVAIICFGFLILNFLLTFFLGFIWGYSAVRPALTIINGARAAVMSPFAITVIASLTMFLEILIFCLIALMISTIFKSRAGAVSISMLVFFVSYVLGAFLSIYSWYRFIIFNNSNLFIYFTSAGPGIADMTLGFSLIINAIYIAVIAFASFFTFSKRDAV
jgi:ABC-2 type transport system permease protein